jgi:hypothetical protein
MANPVTVVESGGVPVVDVTPSGTPASNPSTVGVPVTPAENARPVTIVASGAPPVVFISDDGTEYLPGGLAPGSEPDWVLTGTSFGFDFTEEETWDGIIRGDPADFLTCSRGSGKWVRSSSGLHTFIGNDVLPLTNVGLLVEDQATNLCLHSEDFTNAYYAQGNLASVTRDQTAPDGTTTACLITENTASGGHNISPASSPISFTNGQPYVQSWIVKAGTCTSVQLTFSSAAFSGLGYRNYNLATGALGSTGGTISDSGIISLGGDWYLIWLSATCNSTNNATALLVMTTSTSAGRSPSYAGTSRTLTAWSCDIVNANGPTSHITTAGVTATRMADVISLSGDAETAALASKAAFFKTAYAMATTNGRLIDFNGTQEIDIASATSGRISNGTNTASATLGASARYRSGVIKTAAGYDASLAIVANNGTPATSANAWGTPSGTVYIGNTAAGTAAMRGLMQQLMFSATDNQFSGDTA